MASSDNGEFIFLAVGDRIDVHRAPDFSSKNPPDPESLFPFNPLLILRPTPQQLSKLSSRCAEARDDNVFVFNHIRSGFIGSQESLVAVGEYGGIFVWNISNLNDAAVMLESDDFASTWGIAMSPNNSLLAVSSNSHAITIFDYPRRKVLLSHTTQTDSEGSFHTHNIPCLDFSPCGFFLVSCSIDESVIIWSLIDGVVSKLFRKHSMGWGWLVRFVPTQTYDPAPEPQNRKFHKSYYNSFVEETPGHSSDDEEPQSQFYLSVTEAEDGEEIDSDSSSIIEMMDEDISDITNSDDNPEFDAHVNYNRRPAENFSFQFSVLNPNVHLSEGAIGDSWPDEATETDEEDSIEEENYFSDYSTLSSETEERGSTNYNDTDKSGCTADDNDFYSGESDIDTASDIDTSDNSDDTSDERTASQIDPTYLADSINYADGSIEFLDVKCMFLGALICDPELFKSKSQMSVPCPSYDIFYCTLDSIYMLDLRNGSIKACIKQAKQNCLLRQRQGVSFLNQFYGRYLDNRLGMGEWIDKLASFVAVDSAGNFFITSPKIGGNKDANFVDLGTTLMLPERWYTDPTVDIVGYTLITRKDEEFGWKGYIYLMHSNGLLKIYEIAKV